MKDIASPDHLNQWVARHKILAGRVHADEEKGGDQHPEDAALQHGGWPPPVGRAVEGLRRHTGFRPGPAIGVIVIARLMSDPTIKIGRRGDRHYCRRPTSRQRRCVCDAEPARSSSMIVRAPRRKICPRPNRRTVHLTLTLIRHHSFRSMRSWESARLRKQVGRGSNSHDHMDQQSGLSLAIFG